jgi:nitrite reductase/ring-hydroxylating ferredoxin subunit
MLLFFFTCTKEYSNPIPVRHVFLEVDLTFRDKVLQPVPSYKIFNSKNTVHGKEFTGYGGVLVTNSIFGGYKAFDLACPNEVRSDAVVEIDDDYNAVCKVCGSKYEVISTYGSGACISGPSKYSLRPYHTEQRDKNLIVRN